LPPAGEVPVGQRPAGTLAPISMHALQCCVGCGDITDLTTPAAAGCSPYDLIAAAARLALADTGAASSDARTRCRPAAARHLRAGLQAQPRRRATARPARPARG